MSRFKYFMRLVVLALWAFSPTLAQSATTPAGTTSTATSAFFYQTVNPGASIVRAGATSDGKVVSIYNVDLVYALNKSANTSIGDPVFSRLSSGNWAMTGWTSPGDTRGNGLMYHESSCPVVDESKIRVLSASSATGCRSGASTSMSKSSQIFSVNGSNYVFVNSGGEIYLTRLSDATRNTADLSSICMRQTAATTFDDLAFGESTLVVSKSLAGNLLLSDTGIARRSDGTWVLFIKGIASDSGCSQGSLCELCARNVYRTTSSNLINWSALEKVVGQASVPEAVTYPDGSVWLYHQNFAKACTANDSKLALRAAITGLKESTGYVMESGVDVFFEGEEFETNTTMHYPTNGNPIALPDATAKAMLDACIADTTPATFSFTAVTGAAVASVSTSDTITVSGINTASPISISGGEYQIGSGAWTSAAGTVLNGDTVRVRVTSSASYSTVATATLTIGGVSGTFSVTTHPSTEPDPFAFTAVSKAERSTSVTSNTVTLTGFDGKLAISISGGQYSLDGKPYTSAAGTVSKGSTVAVKQTSSASYGKKTSAILTVGTASATFNVTTRASGKLPLMLLLE